MSSASSSMLPRRRTTTGATGVVGTTASSSSSSSSPPSSKGSSTSPRLFSTASTSAASAASAHEITAHATTPHHPHAAQAQAQAQAQSRSRSQSQSHSHSHSQSQSQSHIQPSLPSAETERHIAQARAAVVASIGNLLDSELQSRAQMLHDNAGALDKQERDVMRATEGLRRETGKLAKEADIAARKLKEVGNVQNWAEVLERGFLVLEETVRLANGGEVVEEEGEDGSGTCSCDCSQCGDSSDGDEQAMAMDDDGGGGNGDNGGETRNRLDSERQSANLGANMDIDVMDNNAEAAWSDAGRSTRRARESETNSVAASVSTT